MVVVVAGAFLSFLPLRVDHVCWTRQCVTLASASNWGPINTDSWCFPTPEYSLTNPRRAFGSLHLGRPLSCVQSLLKLCCRVVLALYTSRPPLKSYCGKNQLCKMLTGQLLALTLAMVPALVSAAIFPADTTVKMLDAKSFKKVMKVNVGFRRMLLFL